MKNIAEQILETSEKIVYTFVPSSNIVDVFNLPFLRNLNTKAERKNITAKTIWFPSIPGRDVFPNLVRSNSRTAPQDLNLKSIIVTHDSYVTVFSSLSPPDNLIAFVVEDEDFAETIKSLFTYVWKQSKKG